MPRLSKIGAAALAAFGWTGLSSVSASYLVVAGGAAGGSNYAGGGGGAGGYLTGTTSLNPTQSYAVTVGAGGAPTTGTGANGSNSVFNAITSIGGGGGGKGENTTAPSSGGSGGGGGGGNPLGGNTGAAGTVGQGNAGGDGVNTSWYSGGGGGGASAVGGNGAGGASSGLAIGGNGGAGTASSITGSSVTRAGGGGGAAFGTAGTGGAGGGGAGSISGAGTAGTANLGGGGGGGGGAAGAGGSGGSGVVIISYLSPQKFGGGIVTTDGTNTIHTFQTSGTLSPLSSLTANFLVIAGAGAGSDYGGGGAGGYRTSAGTSGGGASAESALTIDTNSIYTVTVGAGGTGGSIGTNGSDSVFFSITSTGGGRGAYNTSPTVINGASGGSGGGGRWTGGTGGAGTANQGFAGGNGGTVSGSFPAGGGGGASAVGGNGVTGGNGGNGGAGVASSITGSSVTRAGGGGGGCAPDPSGVGGSGGAGGGGTGGTGGSGTTAGTANTGGGGGGAGTTSGSGGAGGSGVVIISYAGSVQQMAGGTVTISGGNVIHTFTSSGYLTPLTLVGNSLRFRSSASAYLNRTPTVASNRTTWTWSGWVKRGALGSDQALFARSNAGGTVHTGFLFDTNNNLKMFSDSGGPYTQLILITTQVFRDPAAWYHLVVVLDTTQATASNRLKFYVNGSQITAFGTANYPNQNDQYQINTTNPHGLGAYYEYSSGWYFDGYMADINFIDGVALTPNSFGTFNSFGVWQPIVYGGSYGTNGFYLPFTNTANTTTLGLDFSPQNNNWTANNFSLARSSYTSYTSSSGTYTVPAGVTSLSYLVVAGGGGGGSGGGGAGGLLQGTMTVTGGQTIAYSIGAGGTGGNYGGGVAATNGTNTTFGALTAIGGGAGTFAGSNGTAGGSGSGGAGSGSGTTTGGAGTSGQGFAGGGNGGNIASPYPSGGGGGASAAGSNAASSTTSGAGGAGLAWINGTTYAGGGGGGTFSAGNPAGAGGAGGGGAGGSTGNGTAGTANTGGGGGGSPSPYIGGAGGSGIVIIGTGSASTYDSMTDVPTLTSTTAANYAVWNPLLLFPNTTYQATMTNGNLLMTRAGGGQGGAATTIAATTGKFYAEMPVTAVGGSVTKLGVMATNDPSSISAGSEYALGDTSASVAYRSNGARLTGGTTTNSWGATYTTGDVIGVAFDVDTGKVWFSKNGTFQASGDPAAGTNQAATLPTGVPFFFSAGGESGISIALNCGQQPFAYTPPTGFLALNTFNL